MTEQHKNGCHDRPAFVAEYPLSDGRMQKNAFAGKPCEYRHSELGKADSGCDGCARRSDPV